MESATDLEVKPDINKISSTEVEIMDQMPNWPDMITEAMKKEEERIQKQMEKALAKAKELALQEQLDKEAKEMCFKRLQHLLQKSSFYAEFLMTKLGTEELEMQVGLGNKKGESSSKKRKASLATKENESKKLLRDRICSTVSDIMTEEENETKENNKWMELFECGTLRDYQIDGLNWLRLLYENGINGILADEMGLGKTIQCIALICHLIKMGNVGPFLIAAPLSTIPNWVSEFARFSPKIPVVLYHGNLPEREKLRKKTLKVRQVDETTSCFPVVITSYGLIMTDKRFLNKKTWSYIVIDEGHRIKNHKCMLVKDLKTYKSINRLLLTGTPLQNNLAELWSLLNFLLPEIFDDLNVFESWFNASEMTVGGSDEYIIAQEQEKQIIATMHKILSPFLLRRTKSEVFQELPPKRELLVYAPLMPIQQNYYKSTINKTILEVLKGKEEKPVEVNENGRPIRSCVKADDDYSLYFEDDLNESTIESFEKYVKKIETEEKVAKSTVFNVNLRNIAMHLRKICNHPYLIECPIDVDTGYRKVSENMVACAGKLKVLDCLLKALKERGHKVLLFSQMTKLLDIIEDYCEMRDFEYTRLDGRVKLDDRMDNIKLFNEDSNVFLFLLSTRAGGLGINLTAADTVIIFDSDWNPQVDLQAQDRCHRIGQTKPVIIYRLVTANTIDEKIVERANAKRKLEKMIIRKGKFESVCKSSIAEMPPLSTEELLEVLQSKEYDLTVYCDKSDVLSLEEINMLMDRDAIFKTPTENEIRASNKKKVFKVV